MSSFGQYVLTSYSNSISWKTFGKACIQMKSHPTSTCKMDTNGVYKTAQIKYISLSGIKHAYIYVRGR